MEPRPAGLPDEYRIHDPNGPELFPSASVEPLPEQERPVDTRQFYQDIAFDTLQKAESAPDDTDLRILAQNLFDRAKEPSVSITLQDGEKIDMSERSVRHAIAEALKNAGDVLRSGAEHAGESRYIYNTRGLKPEQTLAVTSELERLFVTEFDHAIDQDANEFVTSIPGARLQMRRVQLVPNEPQHVEIRMVYDPHQVTTRDFDSMNPPATAGPGDTVQSEIMGRPADQPERHQVNATAELYAELADMVPQLDETFNTGTYDPQLLSQRLGEMVDHAGQNPVATVEDGSHPEVAATLRRVMLEAIHFINPPAGTQVRRRVVLFEQAINNPHPTGDPNVDQLPSGDPVVSALTDQLQQLLGAKVDKSPATPVNIPDGRISTNNMGTDFGDVALSFHRIQSVDKAGQLQPDRLRIMLMRNFGAVDHNPAVLTG